MDGPADGPVDAATDALLRRPLRFPPAPDLARLRFVGDGNAASEAASVEVRAADGRRERRPFAEGWAFEAAPPDAALVAVGDGFALACDGAGATGRERALLALRFATGAANAEAGPLLHAARPDGWFAAFGRALAAAGGTAGPAPRVPREAAAWTAAGPLAGLARADDLAAAGAALAAASGREDFFAAAGPEGRVVAGVLASLQGTPEGAALRAVAVRARGPRLVAKFLWTGFGQPAAEFAAAGWTVRPIAGAGETLRALRARVDLGGVAVLTP